MAKILNSINAPKIILGKGLRTFTPQDIVRIFRVSPVAATFFVHRNTKKGHLVRLKKSQRGGLYAFSDNVPDPYEIANRIYEPSYISFDSALAFHHLIPETIYSVTSATTQATRTFRIAHIVYPYFKIKKDVYTGYRPMRYRNQLILMAEPEKALADYIYFIALGKRSHQYERIDLKKIDRRKLARYMKLYRRDKMFTILEKFDAHA